MKNFLQNENRTTLDEMATNFVQKYGIFSENQLSQPRSEFIMGLNEENPRYCKIPKCASLE